MKSKEETIEAVEKAHITRVWLDNGWNVTKSALILGIDKRTLYRKLRAYGLYEPNSGCVACAARKGSG